MSRGTHWARRTAATWASAVQLWLCSPCVDAQAAPTWRWHAPETCPDRARVERELRRYVGPDHALAGLTHIEANIRKHVAGLTLVLRVHLQDGTEVTRKLVSNDCDELNDAAALLIALLVDQEKPSTEPPAATPRQPQPQAAPPQPSPAPPDAPPEPLAPDDAARREPASRFTLELAALADTAALPATLSYGARFTPHLRVSRWTLGLAAATLFERARASEAYPPAQVRSGVAWLAPEACFRTAVGDWTLSPCAQVELGVLWLATRQIERPSEVRDLWLAAGAALRAQWWLHPRVAMSAGLGLSVPLHRSRFLIDTEDGLVALHRSAPAGLRISLGLTYAGRR